MRKRICQPGSILKGGDLGWHAQVRCDFKIVNKVEAYVLRSEAGQLYVGLTNHLPRRLAEHARRQSPSTRRLKGELALIYSQGFSTYREARRHEKFLKSGAGRSFLQSDERNPKTGLT